MIVFLFIEGTKNLVVFGKALYTTGLISGPHQI